MVVAVRRAVTRQHLAAIRDGALLVDLQGAAGSLAGDSEEEALGQFQQMLLSSPAMRLTESFPQAAQRWISINSPCFSAW